MQNFMGSSRECTLKFESKKKLFSFFGDPPLFPFGAPRIFAKGRERLTLFGATHVAFPPPSFASPEGAERKNWTLFSFHFFLLGGRGASRNLFMTFNGAFPGLTSSNCAEFVLELLGQPYLDLFIYFSSHAWLSLPSSSQSTPGEPSTKIQV